LISNDLILKKTLPFYAAETAGTAETAGGLFSVTLHDTVSGAETERAKIG